MKFAESQFVEVVELIQSVDPTRARKDKRRANRTEIRVPIDIKAGTDATSPWKTALLRDISPRGIRLESSFPIQANDSFLLKLPQKAQSQPQSPLICRAAHCTPMKASFIIGAEFVGRQSAGSTGADAQAELDRIRNSILG